MGRRPRTIKQPSVVSFGKDLHSEHRARSSGLSTAPHDDLLPTRPGRNMTTSPVSRFEELPDEELAPSTSLATDSTAASMAGGPSERPSAFTTDETSDDDDEGEDSWWTPSELRDLLEHAQELKQRGNA